MELLLGTIVGAICGAILVGLGIVAFIWWQNQQRNEQLRSEFSQTAPTSSLPATDYLRPSPVREAAAEYPTEIPYTSPPAGVVTGTAWLDGVGGIVKGQRMILSHGETLMGRSGVCDLQFHDPKVSRQHAMLRFHQSEYYIQDMQSSRGTFINGRRIETHQLRDRDQIQMGDSILIFRRM